MCESEWKGAQRPDDGKGSHGEYGQHTVEGKSALEDETACRSAMMVIWLRAREGDRRASCASNSWLSRGSGQA